MSAIILTICVFCAVLSLSLRSAVDGRGRSKFSRALPLPNIKFAFETKQLLALSSSRLVVPNRRLDELRHSPATPRWSLVSYRPQQASGGDFSAFFAIVLNGSKRSALRTGCSNSSSD